MTDAPRERPLSPHTTIWRWHLTMATSILHRASGCALYGGGLILAIWAMTLAAGPEAYGTFKAVMGSFPGKIVMFGLTGGLIPCPAAVTVLLLCLQVKEVALGGMLVLCFSIGLALTLVAVGVAAAIGAKQASNRWPWLGTVARRAPYLSSVLIIGVGLYVGIHGWIGLNV